MSIAHVVSSTPAGGANGGTTSGIDTTGANLIVLGTCSYNLVATPTVSDNKSNTYTALTTYTSTGARVILYYCLAPTVGSGHTFTISQTGSFSVISAKAFSGVKTSSPFDQQNGNNFNAAATGIQTNSVTPTENNELLVTVLGHEGSTPAPTINLSFTTPSVLNYSAGNNFGFALSYLIQGTAAATNPTWTFSSTSNQAAAIATFKSAPAGGGNIFGRSALDGLSASGSIKFTRVD